MSTNAQLAAQITDLLRRWNEREAQFRSWLAGTADGGPNGDGKFPLTDASGRTVLVDSPAKLQSLVAGPAAQSAAARDAAVAARDTALAHRNQASEDRDKAEAARTASQQARDQAQVFRNEAAAAAAALSSARDQAVTARDQAVAAKVALDAARDTAVAARDQALGFRNEAQTFRNQAESFASSINPASFAPAVHSHTIAQITGLQAALDGKLNTTGGSLSGALTVGGNLTVNSIFVQTGLTGAGNGGNFRVVDDGGTPRWLMGLLGPAGHRDFAVHHMPTGTTPFRIEPNSVATFGSAVRFTNDADFRLDKDGAGNPILVLASNSNFYGFNRAGVFHDFLVNGFSRFRVTAGGAEVLGGLTLAGNLSVSGGVTSDLGFSQGNAIRFGHVNQTDTNDGIIAAGRFAPGLNIVGVQTQAGTGRQIRYYGTLVDQQGFGAQFGALVTAPQFSGNINVANTLEASTALLQVRTSHGIQIFDTAGNSRGYLWHDGAASGLLNNSGSWAVRVPHNTQNVEIGNDLRARDIRADRGNGTGAIYFGPGDRYLFFNGANMELWGAGNHLRIQTDWGFLQTGPMNSAFCHFQTDRPTFYFNKSISVDGQPRVYLKGGMLFHDNPANSEGRVIVSATQPSGMSNGDIWLQPI